MKKILITSLIIYLLIIAGIIFLRANMTFFPYSQKTLVIEDSVFQEMDPFITEMGEVLVRFDIIKKEIDPYIFWDEKVQKVTITTRDKTIRLKTDSLRAMVNTKPVWIKIPVKIHREKPYIPIEFLAEFFGIRVTKFPDRNTVVIDFLEKERQVAEISKKQPLKAYPSPLSFNYKVLETGEKVCVYGNKGEWYLVRTDEGILGYIKKPRNIKTVVYGKPDFDNSIPAPWKPARGKINMVWDYIGGKTPDMSGISIKGLDVISPTWFSLVDEEGNIDNKGDINYVRWAHNNGYKVWALIDNSFNPDITSTVLNNTELREKVINQILVYAGLYNLDGINIDFENVYLEDRDALTQFVRELAPILREQGLVISIDVTVKSLSENWSLCYDRKNLGQAVDYMILMAYDEHWAGSPVSGSVASIGWVERGIRSLLEEVPAHKVILGLPFYTREWQERLLEGGKLEVKSKALSMASAQQHIRENKADVVWKEEYGQHFATYTKGEYTFKVWLEDERSIDLKSSLIKKYNLAGAASWRRGFEEPEIWEVLYNNLEKFNFNTAQ
ncbi:Putative sporulation-specific glycosylase YdhD [Koleobacter methoxysyntrophicus]|uniref:Sporulation-specific glycosylase YdhD n=1 Tax=Koleobacter methoxysyntrophicus TaxID=2751313 RepID=A0A8A0RPC0_9FIRM|nr:glycosyl hydrolase family 18 protein [Koleobacter methoxysyntrophicus]QSQ09420.1 Putative sporulation-specific glycosylase YdhD [Koleobacter methoxysyntrophicus]